MFDQTTAEMRRMRVLVVGGSGYVGRLTLPALAEHWDLRVYDLVSPVDSAWDYVQGDIGDLDRLCDAANGMDVLLYMAMGQGPVQGVNAPTAAYDVNVKGVHMALAAAVRTGIRRAIYTSSLSVYDGHLDIQNGESDSEEIAPEPCSIYGFTKRLGEEVCRFFHRTHRLPILALRLFLPVSREAWRAGHDPSRVDCRTSAPDLIRALSSAIAYDHTGFEIIHVTGDTTGRAYRHEKAKRILGWEPLEM